MIQVQILKSGFPISVVGIEGRVYLMADACKWTGIAHGFTVPIIMWLCCWRDF